MQIAYLCQDMHIYLFTVANPHATLKQVLKLMNKGLKKNE